MKRIIILLGAMGLLVALWTGAWLFVANQIGQQVELAATPVDPEIPALSCEKFSITGFPFRFDANCSSVTITQTDLRITLKQLKATALVYRPTHFLAFAEGPLHISDSFYGTEQEIRFGAAKASLRFNSWQLNRFSFNAENISFHDTLLGDTLLAASPEVELHFLDIPTEHDPETGRASLAIYARAKNAQLSTLGIDNGQLTLEAKITSLPDDIRRLGNTNPMKEWQATGGALILEKLTANDAITSIEMTGQASLDEAGKISGKIIGTSNQLAERFADFVLPEYRKLFFGAAQSDGSYQQTISIVKGTIFVGIAPQGTLPALF